MTRACGVAALALGGPGEPEAARAAVPIGPEFLVNSYTTSDQRSPSVASDSHGNFVVVWQSNGSAGSDTSGLSVQGQRFDASGVPVGAQFQVNSYTTGDPNYPSVASDSAGDFVVVWQSSGSAGSDTSGLSVQGQRFDASGAPVGAPFQVNTYTTSGQYVPSVASDSAGNFVVVWQSNGSAGSDTSGLSVQGQRFDAGGTPVGAPFQVNTYTTNRQYVSSVASDSAGNFVVVWQSNGSAGNDTSGLSVQGQRFDASGAPVGAQFQVNTYTSGLQDSPSVSSDSLGKFAVVWRSAGSSGGDTAGYSIQGQRYNANGAAAGGEFQVNTYTTTDQAAPKVASDSAGNFVVVWQSNGSNGSDNYGLSVQGQRFDASGAPIGAQIQVNTYTIDSQFVPAIASDSAGDFIVAWGSGRSPFTDFSGFSVQGQRFSPEPSPTGEFQVNTYTTNNQSYPSIASDAAGNFVVAWKGAGGNDTSYGGVHGQRLDASGALVAGQFQINTVTTNVQSYPSIASDSAGDFVVVWQTSAGGSAGNDTSYQSVQGQRYDAAGSPIRNEFQVNTYTTSAQEAPKVASDSAGNFVVVWESPSADSLGWSVRGQRYDASGSALGGEFRVNTYTTNHQRRPSVASASNGNFVVVWEGDGGPGSDTESDSIQGRRYEANGYPIGDQFQVNTYTTDRQNYPSVASDAAGNFVVVWQSRGSAGGDDSGYSIQGQCYDAGGSAIGGQFQVNTFTESHQRLPSVASDSNGNFVVVWTSSTGSFNDTIVSVQGQIYNANNGSMARLGGEFQVNAYTSSVQSSPTVATGSHGDFVVVWHSLGSAGSDTSGSSVQGQRYLPEPAFVPGVGAMLAMLIGFARRRIRR